MGVVMVQVRSGCEVDVRSVFAVFAGRLQCHAARGSSPAAAATQEAELPRKKFKKDGAWHVQPSWF